MRTNVGISALQNAVASEAAGKIDEAKSFYRHAVGLITDNGAAFKTVKSAAVGQKASQQEMKYYEDLSARCDENISKATYAPWTIGALGGVLAAAGIGLAAGAGATAAIARSALLWGGFDTAGSVATNGSDWLSGTVSSQDFLQGTGKAAVGGLTLGAVSGKAKLVLEGIRFLNPAKTSYKLIQIPQKGLVEGLSLGAGGAASEATLNLKDLITDPEQYLNKVADKGKSFGLFGLAFGAGAGVLSKTAKSAQSNLNTLKLPPTLPDLNTP